jgi:hypothetical protein
MEASVPSSMPLPTNIVGMASSSNPVLLQGQIFAFDPQSDPIYGSLAQYAPRLPQSHTSNEKR